MEVQAASLKVACFQRFIDLMQLSLLLMIQRSASPDGLRFTVPE